MSARYACGALQCAMLASFLFSTVSGVCEQSDSLNDSVRELREQVRELQSAVAEIRSESQRYRDETTKLRRELDEVRAASSGSTPAAVAAGEPVYAKSTPGPEAPAERPDDR